MKVPSQSLFFRRYKTIAQLLFMIAIAVLYFDTLSRMIYSALGQTAGGRAWNFVLILYGVITIAGLTTGLSRMPGSGQKWLYRLSAACSGALLGFGGSGRWLTGLLQPWLSPDRLLKLSLNPQVATVGAVIGTVLLLGLAWSVHPAAIAQPLAQATIGQRVIWLAQTLTTYAATFLLGVTALTLLSVQQWPLGLCLLGLTIALLGLTSQLLTSPLLQQGWRRDRG
jgi:hypothetical protein